jgi:hypothetical protein
MRANRQRSCWRSVLPESKYWTEMTHSLYKTRYCLVVELLILLFAVVLAVVFDLDSSTALGREES